MAKSKKINLPRAEDYAAHERSTAVNAKTFSRASLITRNFHFQAYGSNTILSRAALLHTLMKHGKQYKLPANWYEQFLGDVEVHTFTLDQGYRDGEAL